MWLPGWEKEFGGKWIRVCVCVCVCVCVYVAESLCCSPEIGITLLIGCTPNTKLKIKKRIRRLRIKYPRH